MVPLWSCGPLTVGFKIDGDVLPNLLNGSGDKQLARDFNTNQFRRVDASLDCVLFIDIETD